MKESINTLTMNAPDDWHIHLRDFDALATTVPHVSANFRRAICMPNLVPPIKTTAQAIAYRERIVAHIPSDSISQQFEPLMVLYLTENLTAQDIEEAVNSGIVKAVKLYPAGATTNSDDGVTNINHCTDVFAKMESLGLPLLLHGEVTHEHVDIFDREKRFIDEVLTQLIFKFPKLKIVFEHITTSDAVDFVLSQSKNICATITPQHLLFNRNHLLVGGLKPHFYCLPVLKRQSHQQVLLDVATSGNPKFFAGTDSAPHATHAKENACGCAGCYSAPLALSLYAQAFDKVDKLDKLEAFMSINGAKFYGLPVNSDKVTLVRDTWQVPDFYEYLGDKTLTPLMAGQKLDWKVLPFGLAV
ncbi:dihydroorotase [Moraxella macacae 0408225]|uniref:Dihydroorotase n=1 Tax=Moraxella macacae 0408225 TaxID=1230338 RepID=L2F6H0_9GAMM|nr:dihydroorotase [Moraxella macacae]ELA08038.1 dihydroorotase [Moraxella macacae 0408225]